MGITDSNVYKLYRRNRLLCWTLSGVLMGIIMGFIMRSANFTKLQRYYWGFPGDVIMMNMLKAVIVPLIIFSITTGVASMAQSTGRLSKWCFIYYLTTTFIAIIIGIVFSYIFRPGEQRVTPNDPKDPQTVADGLLDILRNMFPPNIISAMFQQAKSGRNDKGGVSVSWQGSNPGKPSQNVLGLITWCGTFGFYLGKLAKKGNEHAQQALSLINGMNTAVMAMIDIVMWYHPIGLVFLISAKIMAVDDVEAWKELGMFMVTTIVAIAMQALIVIPGIYYLVLKKNPFVYMKGVVQALLTAFGTASSAATMPITLRNLEVNNKVDSRVVRFMIPLGATINMDGTALYEAICALFIARLEGITLNFGDVITIVFTATAASIGAAAVPSAGLITLVMVLTAVNLPTDNIAWIFTVDWFLDRFRTATNVWGDCCGAAVVQHICQEDLDKCDHTYVAENRAYFGDDDDHM